MPVNQQSVRDFLHDLVSNSPLNHPATLEGPFFAEPLVGFASARDELFIHLQRIIGPFHQTPQQWLAAAGQQRFTGGTVISWVLPISTATRLSNRSQNLEPSRAWALTRNDGELFNHLLRDRLVDFLQARGYLAIAPLRHARWQAVDDPATGLASTWSERHAAYAAGLGTFSLNDGLITAAGIAHRCGSVVTDLVLPADERPYAGIRDYCLYHHDGSCGACIKRCPVNAISTAGHDKYRCRDYTYGILQPRLLQSYGIEISGCGLCQTRVPCEARNPVPIES